MNDLCLKGRSVEPFVYSNCFYMQVEHDTEEVYAETVLLPNQEVTT